MKSTKGGRYRYFWFLAAVVAGYLAISYLILPATWSRIEHEPGLAKRAMVTSTAQGIPGDAINVGLIGTREDVVSAFHAAGWYPADPITLKSSLDDGRREDLAFEKAVGVSADRRQHVRLWQVLQGGVDGRPVWLGSASFDSGVTLSRDTGQVTHKIAPNIDQERDRLIGDLDQARLLVEIFQIKGVGPTLNGRNGEGDPYYTDGEIWMAKLVTRDEKAAAPAKLAPRPALIQLKDKLFSWSS